MLSLITAWKKRNVRRLQELVHSYMGDTPINLSSPEQVSSMMFSYTPKDKKAHAVLYQLDSPFRPRISVDRFRKLVHGVQKGDEDNGLCV